MKFKIGDKVRVDPELSVDTEGTIKQIREARSPIEPNEYEYLLHIGEGIPDYWYYEDELEHIDDSEAQDDD